MPESQVVCAGLSDTAQTGVEQFLRELTASPLVDEIIAIVLYGSVVRHTYSSTSSDVNIMVVLKDVHITSLDQLAGPVERGRREFALSVLVLSEQELRRSTDVFPIKFLDIQRHHRILHGSDVLSTLEISRTHLRLRCEQELRNLMLRLHQFYLFRANYPERLEQTLMRAASSLLMNLAVLVELKTDHAPSSTDEIIAAAAQFQLNVVPIKTIMSLKHGEIHLQVNELKQLYEKFTQTVHHAVQMADRL